MGIHSALFQFRYILFERFLFEVKVLLLSKSAALLLFALALPFPFNMAKGKREQFSPEQKQFIIDEFLKNKSATEVKRAFRKEFGQSRALAKRDKSSFKSVFDTFKKGGQQAVGVTKAKSAPKSKVNEQTLNAVKAHFEENNKSSIREAARELEISPTTTYQYVSEHLKMKAYKVSLPSTFFKEKCFFAK